LDDRKTIDRKMKLEQELPQRKRAASPNKQIMMKDAVEICKSDRKNSPHLRTMNRKRGRKKAAAAVDIQDNPDLIWHYLEARPELK
jgi:hypothetical protein